MESIINFDNMFSFSPEDIFNFLQRTIDQETNKGKDGIDTVLVEECILTLEQLYVEDVYSPTKSQIEEKYKELKKIYEEVKDDKAFWNDLTCDNDELNDIINCNSDQREDKKRGFSLKKLFLISAAVLIISSLMVATVGANTPLNSHSPTFFGIPMKEFIKYEHYKDGDIEYTNLNEDKARYYSSLKDCAKGENIQGIFFPESLEIKQIIYSEYEGKKDLVFNPTDQDTYFSINIESSDKCGIEYNPPTYTKTKTKNGIDVWIYEKNDEASFTGSTQVMFKINEWYYCICTSYPEKAIELIDEFKEILP